MEDCPSHTERLPAYDLFKDYKEVQKRMVPSADLIRPVANRLVLEHATRHFMTSATPRYGSMRASNAIG